MYAPGECQWQMTVLSDGCANTHTQTERERERERENSMRGIAFYFTAVARLREAGP